MEGDGVVFQLDFHPTAVAPNPEEYRDSLRDMIKLHGIEGEIISMAELFGGTNK